MVISLRRLGSLVLDIAGNRLDAQFLRSTGAVDDYFSIIKNISNAAPAVSLTNPVEGARFSAPASITIDADSSDSDGSVQQVDFYADGTAAWSRAE